MSAPPGQLAAIRSKLNDQLVLAQRQLTRAHLHRQVYRDVREAIVAQHPHAPATFIMSYAETYITHQLMLIRRLTDRSSDRPVSLHWIIQKVRNNPRVVPRAEFILTGTDQYEAGSWERQAWIERNEDEWARHWGDGDLPSDDQLAQLQDQLHDGAVKAMAWVDKRVAHWDSTDKPIDAPTFAEVDDTLDTIDEVMQKMNLLIRRATVLDEVAIQDDWRAPLRASLWPDELRR